MTGILAEVNASRTAHPHSVSRDGDVNGDVIEGDTRGVIGGGLGGSVQVGEGAGGGDLRLTLAEELQEPASHREVQPELICSLSASRKCTACPQNCGSRLGGIELPDQRCSCAIEMTAHQSPRCSPGPTIAPGRVENPGGGGDCRPGGQAITVNRQRYSIARRPEVKEILRISMELPS